MARTMPDGTVVMIDGDAAIVIDERCHPVMVTTWFGLATVEIVDQYYEWLAPRLRKARVSGERLMMLSDTFAVERPTPKVRARLAERTKAQSQEDAKAMIASVLVLENVLVRGAVTALSWILPSMSSTEIVGSIDEGIERCAAIAKNAELEIPDDFRRYRRPQRPKPG